MTDPVAAHVDALARAVHGPPAARRSVLREVRDGLEDAVDAYRRGGVDAARAAELAVRDFGPVSRLAPLYQDELAAGAGRRTAALVAVGLPGLLLSWNLLLADKPPVGPPASAGFGVLVAVQDVAAVLASVVALALVVLGRGTGSPRRIAVTAAATALVTVAVCGGTAVAMNLTETGHAWARLTGQPATLPVYLASAAMVALLCRSAARTLCALRPPAGYDRGGRSAVHS